MKLLMREMGEYNAGYCVLRVGDKSGCQWLGSVGSR